MAPALGKRKRVVAEVPEKRSKVVEEVEEDSSDGEEIDAQEIFRRHFEAQFKPLPEVKKAAKPVEAVAELEQLDEDEDDDESGSDWDGLSGEEDEVNEENQVEVIEHTKMVARATMSKEELKKFMSSKVPSSVPTASTITKAKLAAKDDEDTSEAGNLKKDLELQRLLNESHLLDNSANPTLVGKNRHKATDLRLQALGSKGSIFEQKSMPASHRRGMVAKAGEREHNRRTEARENGIILEKAKPTTKKFDTGKRERGVGAPGVGRFSGGTLTLSKQDIADIEGPKRSSSGRGGRGGRGGGGRGRGGKGKRGGR